MLPWAIRIELRPDEKGPLFQRRYMNTYLLIWRRFAIRLMRREPTNLDHAISLNISAAEKHLHLEIPPLPISAAKSGNQFPALYDVDQLTLSALVENSPATDGKRDIKETWHKRGLIDHKVSGTRSKKPTDQRSVAQLRVLFNHALKTHKTQRNMQPAKHWSATNIHSTSNCRNPSPKTISSHRRLWIYVELPKTGKSTHPLGCRVFHSKSYPKPKLNWPEKLSLGKPQHNAWYSRCFYSIWYAVR